MLCQTISTPLSCDHVVHHFFPFPISTNTTIEIYKYSLQRICNFKVVATDLSCLQHLTHVHPTTKHVLNIRCEITKVPPAKKYCHLMLKSTYISLSTDKYVTHVSRILLLRLGHFRPSKYGIWCCPQRAGGSATTCLHVRWNTHVFMHHNMARLWPRRGGA